MFPTKCPVCSYNSLVYDVEQVRCSHCEGYTEPLKWHKRPLVWARGKAWWWRLLILIWVLYIFYRYIDDYDYPMQRMSNIFNAIDFGIHEVGHYLFVPFGEFMTILGGSLLQTIFPLFWLGALYWKRWYFAASLCFIWVGLNLYDVATYAADARARLLPLATLSSDYDSAHDWYQILTRTGKLESDLAIARNMRITGTIFVIVGTFSALWLIGIMIFVKKPEPPVEETAPKPEDLKGKKPSELYPDPTKKVN